MDEENLLEKIVEFAGEDNPILLQNLVNAKRKGVYGIEVNGKKFEFYLSDENPCLTLYRLTKKEKLIVYNPFDDYSNQKTFFCGIRNVENPTEEDKLTAACRMDQILKISLENREINTLENTK